MLLPKLLDKVVRLYVAGFLIICAGDAQDGEMKNVASGLADYRSNVPFGHTKNYLTCMREKSKESGFGEVK